MRIVLCVEQHDTRVEGVADRCSGAVARRVVIKPRDRFTGLAIRVVGESPVVHRTTPCAPTLPSIDLVPPDCSVAQ